MKLTVRASLISCLGTFKPNQATLGFFIFSATGRRAVGAATRVGAAKAKKRLKKWEKKHA